MRRQDAGWWLMILPAFLLMTAFYVAPIAQVLAISFTEPSPGLGNYERLFTSESVQRVILTTLRICVITTSLALLLGYILAYKIALASEAARQWWILAVLVPLWISVLVRTYAWIVVLGNNGMVNRLLMWSGLTDSPVSFLYNELGVMIGLANVLLPFLVLPLFAAMLRIDDRLMQAAASLGAPAHTIFLKVFLPLTLPALASGALLVFILCLGFYVTPAILGGGKVPMISNLLDFLINQIPRWEQASALSTLLLIVTLAVFAAYRALDRKVGA